MANATLLSLFQTTLQGMGVTTYGLPATVISNTNQDVVQTLALVNAAGDELTRIKDSGWQAQQLQYLFTAVYYTYTGDVTANSISITNMSSIAGISTNPTYFQVTGTGINQDTFVTAATGSTVTINQVAATSGTTVSLTFSQVLFPFPSGFDRLIDRTDWDKGKHWEMLGPKTPQEWEWLKSGYISTGPRIRYRQFGNVFAIWPPLGATELLSYEYVSKFWIVAANGTAPTKQLFTVDTDTTIFPDPLMRATIKLKYLEAKGLDTTAAFRDWEAQRDIAIADDAGSATLSLNPRPGEILIGWRNIPDSRYGQN